MHPYSLPNTDILLLNTYSLLLTVLAHYFPSKIELDDPSVYVTEKAKSNSMIELLALLISQSCDTSLQVLGLEE